MRRPASSAPLRSTFFLVPASVGLACLALAGCTGDIGGDALPDVFGTVSDSSGAGIADAAVRSVDGVLATTTAADGSFSFPVVGLDGPVTLVAEKDGYLTQHAHVVIDPGLAVRVGFTLMTFEEVGGLSQTLEHNGYLPCDSHVGTLRQPACPFIGDRRDTITIDLADGVVPVTGLLIEVEWDDIVGQPLRVEVRDGDDVLAHAEGVAPLRVLLTAEDVQRPVAQIVVLPGAGSAYVSQPFTTWATVFFVQAPPDGYSAVGE
jgi:hypothetical protein